MKERPILFSGAMIRAILAGQKTQSRRIAPFSTDDHCTPFKYINRAGNKVFGRNYNGAHELSNIHCPYGQPGDRLWVKESWSEEHPLAVPDDRYSQPGRGGISGPPGVKYRVIYKTDGEPKQVWRRKDNKYPYFTLDGPADEIAAEYPSVSSNFNRQGKGIYWTRAQQMPRWASRILLEIVNVRVERLQDISEADALAEGVKHCEAELDTGGYWYAPGELYSMLWTKIYGWGERGWNANPWVWVVEFRRVAE